MAEWRERGYVPDSDEEEDDWHSSSSKTRSENAEPTTEADKTSTARAIDSNLSSDAHLSAAAYIGQESARTVTFNTNEIPPLHIDVHKRQLSKEILKELRSKEEDQDKECCAPTIQEITIQNSTVADQLQGALNHGLRTVRNILEAHITTDLDQQTFASSPISPLSSLGDLDDAMDLGDHAENKSTAEQDLTERLQDVLRSQSVEYFDQMPRRELRQRKAIQVHPYAIENARYQEILKARGLKPLRLVEMNNRERSPTAPDSLHESLPSSSQADVPPSTSTSSPELSNEPAADHNEDRSVWGSSIDLGAANDGLGNDFGDELPDLSDILRSHHGKVTVAERTLEVPWNRNKVSYELPKSHHLHVEAIAGNKKSLSDLDMLYIPPSPPSSAPLLSSATSIVELDRFTTDTHALPTPVLSSENHARKRSVINVLDSSSSSESDFSDGDRPGALFNSELEQNGNLLDIKRKIKGVLPASWLKLDLRKHNNGQIMHPGPTAPYREKDAKGVARRMQSAQSNPISRSPGLVGISNLGDEVMSEDESDADNSSIFHRRISNSLIPAEQDCWVEDVLEDNHVQAIASRSSRQKHVSSKPKKSQRRPKDPWTVQHSEHSLELPFVAKANTSEREPHVSRLRYAKQRRKRQRRNPPLQQLSILDAPGFMQLPTVSQPRFLKVATRRARRQIARNIQTSFQLPDRKFFRLTHPTDTDEINKDLLEWQSGRLRQIYQQPEEQFEGTVIAKNILSRVAHDHNRTSHHHSGNRNLADHSNELTALKKSSAITVQRSLFREKGMAGITLCPDIPLAVRPTKETTTKLDGFVQHPQRRVVAPNHLRPIRLANVITKARQPQLETVAKSPVQHLPRKQVPRFRRGQAFNPDSPIEDDLVNKTLTTLISLSHLQEGTIYTTSTFIGRGGLQETISTCFDRNKKTSLFPVELVDPCTMIRYRWGPVPNLAELEKAFDNMYLLLEPLLNSKTDKAAAWKTVDATTVHCIEFLEALISYVNNELCFSRPEQIHVFVYTSVNIVKTFLLRFDVNISDQNRNAAPFDLLLILNLLVVYTWQLSKMCEKSASSATTQSDEYREIVCTLFEGITQKTLAFALTDYMGDDLEAFLRCNQAGGDQCRVIKRFNHPQVDTILIVKSLCFGSSIYPRNTQSPDGHETQAQFNKILADALEEKTRSGIPRQESCLRLQAMARVCPLLELDALGKHQSHAMSALKYNAWSTVASAVRTFTTYFLESQLQQAGSMRKGSSCDRALGHAIFAWCFELVNTWSWDEPEKFLKDMIQLFKENDMKQIFSVPRTRFPDFLVSASECQRPSLTLDADESDFHICLKMIAKSLSDMGDRVVALKRSGEENSKTFRNMMGRLHSFVFALSPNSGETLRAEDAVSTRDYASVVNRCSLYTVLYIYAPTECQPQIGQIANLIDVSRSHASVCSIVIEMWRLLTKFQILQKEDVARLDGFVVWIQSLLHKVAAKYRSAEDEVKLQLRDAGAFLSHEALLIIRVNQESVTDFLVKILGAWLDALRTCSTALQVEKLLGSGALGQLRSLCEQSFGNSSPIIQLKTMSIFDQYFSVMASDVEGSRTHATTMFTTARNQTWNLLQMLLASREISTAWLQANLKSLIKYWFSAAQADVLINRAPWENYIDSTGLFSWERGVQSQLARRCKVEFMRLLISSDAQYFAHRTVDLLKYWIDSLLQPAEQLQFEHELTSEIFRQDAWTFRLLDGINYKFSYTENGYQIGLTELLDARISILLQVISNMKSISEWATSTTDSQEGMFLLTNEDLKPILNMMMSTMKSVYYSLAPTPEQQKLYALLVESVVKAMYVHTHHIAQIDRCFLDEFVIEESFKFFLLRSGNTESKISKEHVQWLQNKCVSAALGDLQQPLSKTLRSAFVDRETTSTDHEYENRFMQLVLPAYIERAFETPVSIMAKPIFETLPYLFTDCLYKNGFSKAKNLNTFSGAAFAMVEAVKDAFACLTPAEIRSSDLKLKVFWMILDFLGPAIMQCDQIHNILGRAASFTRLDLIIYKRYFIEYASIVAEEAYPEAFKIDFPTQAHGNQAHKIQLRPTDIEIKQDARKMLSEALSYWSQDTAGSWWVQEGRSARKVLEECTNIPVENEALEKGGATFTKFIGEMSRLSLHS